MSNKNILQEDILASFDIPAPKDEEPTWEKKLEELQEERNTSFSNIEDSETVYPLRLDELFFEESHTPKEKIEEQNFYAQNL